MSEPFFISAEQLEDLQAAVPEAMFEDGTPMAAMTADDLAVVIRGVRGGVATDADVAREAAELSPALRASWELFRDDWNLVTRVRAEYAAIEPEALRQLWDAFLIADAHPRRARLLRLFDQQVEAGR